MPPSAFSQLEAELYAIRRAGRYRSCPPIHGPSRTTIVLDNTELVSFSSNDYLGLSCHPDVIRAAVEAMQKSGFGAASSRLIAGTFPEHRVLEQRLADLVRLPSALLFPSGYQANLGAITALAGPSDLIVADRAVHASLIDACRLSRAKLAFYPHLDLHAAEKHLFRLGQKARRRLLVTESLYSMDGDAPDLLALSRIAIAHDAILYVDEAHALGTLGPQGRGLCAAARVTPDVLVGTLGKALGASGAFVAGPTVLQDYLVNRSRPFIFTTSLPPPVAAAANQAVLLATSQEGTTLRHHLSTLVAQLRADLGLPPDPVGSPIVPMILGEAQLALDVAAQLKTLGFFVQPIRPPTVREGTSRLRISLSASHSQDQVTSLCRAIVACLPRGANSEQLGNQSPGNPNPPSPPLPPLKPRRGIILLGTDTSVGKTAVAQGLLHILVSLGQHPVPYKPVETGTAQLPTDSSLLRSAAQRNDLPIQSVCPFSFPDPIAPAAAASRANISITPEDLRTRAEALAASGDPLIVESAGGLLSPYAPGFTAADLAAMLGYPILLIARNALGTVNHTALAVSEIRRRGLPLVGIILVDTSETPAHPNAHNLSLITDATGVAPLGILPFLPNATPTTLAAALREHVNLDAVLPSLAI